jgi:hypothetical protein
MNGRKPSPGLEPTPSPAPDSDSGAERAGFEARIRELAYLLWESGGRHYGHALEYWLAAEREVLRTFERAQDRLMGIGPGTEAGGEPEAKAASDDVPEKALPAAKPPPPLKK